MDPHRKIINKIIVVVACIILIVMLVDSLSLLMGYDLNRISLYFWQVTFLAFLFGFSVSFAFFYFKKPKNIQMHISQKIPKVGVGVIIEKNDKVLLGKRKNAHGKGTWCFPGGHLEYKESWIQSARREVREETGLEIKEVQFEAATNDIFEKEQKHYVTIFMKAKYESGEVQIKEPEKCERWDWFSWDSLPAPLFTPIENLLKEK